MRGTANERRISNWPTRSADASEAAQLVFEHIGSGEFESVEAFFEAFDAAIWTIADRMPYSYTVRDVVWYAQDKGWLIRHADDSMSVRLPAEWDGDTPDEHSAESGANVTGG